MDYKYLVDTTCVLGPQQLQCSREYKNAWKKLAKVSWLFIHATKI